MSIVYLIYVYFQVLFSLIKYSIRFRVSIVFFPRYPMNINHYCLFIFLITKIPIHSFTVVHDVKQATFINPQTNTALVRCPLKLKPNFQIQWFDVVNNRYEKDHGINYYIHGLQSIDRILICSSTSDDGLETSEKYRIQVRVYGKNTYL